MWKLSAEEVHFTNVRIMHDFSAVAAATAAATTAIAYAIITAAAIAVAALSPSFIVTTATSAANYDFSIIANMKYLLFLYQYQNKKSK